MHDYPSLKGGGRRGTLPNPLQANHTVLEKKGKKKEEAKGGDAIVQRVWEGREKEQLRNSTCKKGREKGERPSSQRRSDPSPKGGERPLFLLWGEKRMFVQSLEQEGKKKKDYERDDAVGPRRQEKEKEGTRMRRGGTSLFASGKGEKKKGKRPQCGATHARPRKGSSRKRKEEREKKRYAPLCAVITKGDHQIHLTLHRLKKGGKERGAVLH